MEIKRKLEEAVRAHKQHDQKLKYWHEYHEQLELQEIEYASLRCPLRLVVNRSFFVARTMKRMEKRQALTIRTKYL